MVASGPPHADPVMLLNPAGGSATIGRRNVEPLSQCYRTYTVDVIGEMNKSVPTQLIRNHLDLKQWMTCLLDDLGVQAGLIIGNPSAHR